MTVEMMRACALTQGVTQVNVVDSPAVNEVSIMDPDRPRSLADDDGVTHINIDLRAKTKLGRQLSHVYRLQYEHPEFGPFVSIQGLIGFIRSGCMDDQFHYLAGMAARDRSLATNSDFILGFREIVMEANYFKIVQNDELRKLFVESTLPFDQYYLHDITQRPIHTPAASWVLPGMETIRQLLKENRPYPTVSYEGVSDPHRRLKRAG